jgi:hypothetical protein
VHCVLAPRNKPLRLWQFVWVVTMHDAGIPAGLLARQQAPVTGVGQVVDEHTEFAPIHVPFWLWHCASVVTVQRFVALPGMQHAPVGAVFGQLVAEQIEPEPRNVPPAVWHCCAVSELQCAGELGVAGMQHAPGTVVVPQGTLAQVDPSPKYVPAWL